MNETPKFELDRDGVMILPGILSRSEAKSWTEKLDGVFSQQLTAIKNRGGAVYAARNILDAIPAEFAMEQRPAVRFMLDHVLGSDYGLVRGLYFDKHPDRTWSLPWHKDLTIAVKDNSLPSALFAKPTLKSGVPHVEAPESVLKNMLTIRVHLDDVTEENGPLEIVMGSHRYGKRSATEHRVEKILVEAGDVLAMRPLVSHASGSSQPGTHLHRRILHFEFAAQRELPDGFQWQDFRRSRP
jgi:hypothetical protein